MNSSEALSRLRKLAVPVFETADAAAALQETVYAASKTLSRLRKAQLVTRIRHGVWSLDATLDPYRLAEYLTAPFPAYVSLQSALYLHGMIEQIPNVVYAVSLARSQRIATTRGSFSIHHIAPELFGGFTTSREGVTLATPEKALFDLVYLSGTRTRLFTKLPELEIPRGFKKREVDHWIRRIPSKRASTLVSTRMSGLLTTPRS